jgi:hypothetical protein
MKPPAAGDELRHAAIVRPAASRVKGLVGVDTAAGYIPPCSRNDAPLPVEEPGREAWVKAYFAL